jgi:ABC-type nitrate/sulfonate/bicarbonate transport system substrate-binding protein
MSTLPMMEYKMGLKSVMIILVFLISACDPENSENPTLRLAGVNYLGDLPTLVADKDQIFKKHHLNVQVSFNESGKQGLEDLKAGKVDFALMAPTPLMLDKLTNVYTGHPGNEPVILGNLLHSTSMNQILTSSTDKNIQTVSDLKDGRIGLAKGSNAEYIWWLYSNFYQVELDKVEIIDLLPKELGQALIDKKVDAIVTWQPWTNHIIANYGDKVKQIEGSHVYSAKWLLVTTRQMVEDNPKYCQQLLKAYAEAINVIHTDTENIMEMYAKEMNEAGIIGNNYEPGLHQLNLNWSLISELHQGIQWAKLNNFPGSENKTDVISWFSPEPLRTIQPFSVKIPTITVDDSQP